MGYIPDGHVLAQIGGPGSHRPDPPLLAIRCGALSVEYCSSGCENMGINSALRWTSPPRQALLSGDTVRGVASGSPAPDRPDRRGCGWWKPRDDRGARRRRRAPMPKLTDTQLIILSTAGQRSDGVVLPLPKSLKLQGGAVSHVLTKLLDKGLPDE